MAGPKQRAVTPNTLRSIGSTWGKASYYDMRRRYDRRYWHHKWRYLPEKPVMAEWE